MLQKRLRNRAVPFPFKRREEESGGVDAKISVERLCGVWAEPERNSGAGEGELEVNTELEPD